MCVLKHKKKEKTILVSGASGIVGYGILKSLRLSQEKYTLIGTTIHDNSVAPAFSDIFEKAPLTSDANYVFWLVDIVNKYNVNMIIPSIEVDMIAWNDNRQILQSETKTLVLLNNPALINLCNDKWLFYQELQKNASIYAIPTSLEFNFQEHKFPFLLKPRRGYASRGIVLVENEEMLDSRRNDIGSTLMVQPIIGKAEEEYTTSAFFDKFSRLCCYMSLKRTLSKEGFTETAQTIDIENMENVLLELAEIFKPIGPTNFQFRVHNSQLKLLEINPRISSATSIRAALGYNESIMSVDYFMNNIVPTQPVIKKGSATRYTEDFIFYDSPNL
jgi:carbamoyl-phosphate synthase large subunit